MQPHDVQKEVRELITDTDQVSRHAHAAASEATSERFASLRTTLMRLDRWLGARTPHPGIAGELDLVYQRVKDAAARAAPEHRAEILPLLETAEKLRARMRTRELPSRPLFGVLPLARVVPQRVHSVMDYATSLAAVGVALTTRSPRARAAGLALGVAGASVSATTDYDLSLAKVIPIEAHEAIDYGWSLAAIAAPFALGFARRAKVATAVLVASGVLTIVGSLITDYRAARGIGHP